MIRITNQLRAIEARENLRAAGPYRAWLPTNPTRKLLRELQQHGVVRKGDTLYTPDGVGFVMTKAQMAEL